MKKCREFGFSAALAALALGATIAHADYVAPQLEHAPIKTVNVVVPLTVDAPEIVGMKLRNIQNGINAAKQWQGELHAKVVLYAKGVHILDNPAPNFKEAIDALRKEGVEFEVCNNSLREQKIDFHALYGVKDADIVPSGFLEVAWLQQHKGYVVDPSL